MIELIIDILRREILHLEQQLEQLGYSQDVLHYRQELEDTVAHRCWLLERYEHVAPEQGHATQE